MLGPLAVDEFPVGQIGNSAAADGRLEINADAYGAFQSVFGGLGNEDTFDPSGTAAADSPTFSSGLFLFVGQTHRELLSDSCTWQNYDWTQPPPGDPNNYFSADTSLDRVVTDCCNLSDTNGDGFDDTMQSAFAVTGQGVSLSFDLTQFVSEPDAGGASYLRQDYQITNDGLDPLTFQLVRAYDGDLPWSGSPIYSDDWVGAGAIGDNWYVFQQEPNDPRLAVTLSSFTPPDAYYAGKTGVDPDGPGGDPPFQYGTDTKVWDAYGAPPAWENYVAGVGYDTEGVSGSQPPGSISPFDGFVGLQFELTLQPGEQITVTLAHTYGATEPRLLPCPGDLDGDGDVDLSDLALLLAHYGMPSGASYEDGDLDGDGDVDLSDLAALLAVYGTTCP